MEIIKHNLASPIFVFFIDSENKFSSFPCGTIFQSVEKTIFRGWGKEFLTAALID